MTRAALLVALLCAGCPDDPPPNPDKLWLALLGSERFVQLVEEEPPPF